MYAFRGQSLRVRKRAGLVTRFELVDQQDELGNSISRIEFEFPLGEWKRSVEPAFTRLHQKRAADQLGRLRVSLERVLVPRGGRVVLARLLRLVAGQIRARCRLDG